MISVEKIKINMLSGASIEKPLVTAFNSNGGLYVVLDNETNGTMGLPIILVSKLDNGKLVLISDEEWNAVKENLRMIIAGNQSDYVTVQTTLNADDMFFKQLTLPVASFEALKNNYKPVDNSSNIVNEAPVTNNIENSQVSPQQPVDNSMANVSSVGPMPMPEAPAQGPVPTPVAPEPAVAQVVNTPEMPEVPTPSPLPDQVVATPDVTPVAPVMPDAPVQSQTIAQVAPDAPVEAPMPNVEPIPEAAPMADNTPIDFTADKEAFLKACENIFDALVTKFKN